MPKSSDTPGAVGTPGAQVLVSKHYSTLMVTRSSLGGVADYRAQAGEVLDEPGISGGTTKERSAQKMIRVHLEDQKPLRRGFHWPNLRQFEHKYKC